MVYCLAERQGLVWGRWCQGGISERFFVVSALPIPFCRADAFCGSPSVEMRQDWETGLDG